MTSPHNQDVSFPIGPEPAPTLFCMTVAEVRPNRRKAFAWVALVVTALAGWWTCGVIAMLLLGGDIDDPGSRRTAAKVLGSAFAAASVLFLAGSVFVVVRKLLARCRDRPTAMPA